MFRVNPFPGVLYNQTLVGQVGDVVAPPYDVISPAQRDQLYEKHPCNIIRVILGRGLPGDDVRENRYTRAAGYFRKWLSQGILVKDKRPAMYVYDQEYITQGQAVLRRGFLAVVRLEEFSVGKVHPHEQVFPGPQKERMSLLRESGVNFSPLFGLFDDQDRQVDSLVVPEEMLFEFTGVDGIHHRISAIRSPAKLNSISQALEDLDIFIADGHHRYLTALHLRDELERGGSPVPAGADYVLMYLLNMHSPALTVLPVHRLLGSFTSEQVGELIAQMSIFFYRRPFCTDGCNKTDESIVEALLVEIEQSPAYTYGMYSRESGFILLTPRDPHVFDGKLKAAILDDLVHDLLGKTSLEQGTEIDFTTDNKRAVNLVKEGRFQLVFFLPAVKIEEIREVALRGDRMPPKSSYFYPKPFSGLVIRDLEDAV